MELEFLEKLAELWRAELGEVTVEGDDDQSEAVFRYKDKYFLISTTDIMDVTDD